MGKHAYCIIAHTDRYCLERLLNLLDDARNDIYVLLDKKANPSLIKGIALKHSVISTPQLQPIDIQWGGLSQVKAELVLFKTVAESAEDYDFIHLLSGVDLPLKTQNQIHHFFDNLPKGTNLVGFAQGKFNRLDLASKTDYYHLFIEHQKERRWLKRQAYKMARVAGLKIQKLFHWRRNWDGLRLYKGANWVSISKDFCKYLNENSHKILKTFKGVPCADEIFLQTMIANSHFKGTVMTYDMDFAAMTRTIDWNRGKPYTWRKEDYNELMQSNGLFARKFSSAIDKDIIDLIYHKIKSES